MNGGDGRPGLDWRPAIRKNKNKEGDLDYWEPSKRELLTDPHFLKSLVDYDKDNIPVPVMIKLQLFIKNPEFTPERVKKASKAASGICVWVRAMVYYDQAMKELAPKKRKLATAEAEYTAVSAGQLVGRQPTRLPVPPFQLPAGFPPTSRTQLLDRALLACEPKHFRTTPGMREALQKYTGYARSTSEVH